MRLFIFTLLLLSVCAAAPVTQPVPPAYRVLALQQNKLAWVATTVNPLTTYALWWEGGATAPPRVTIDAAGLTIYLFIDVLGSRSPYYLDIRLAQEPGGHVELAAALVSGSPRVAAWEQHFTADSYADLASEVICCGSTLAELLIRLGDGKPPMDLDDLADQLSLAVAPTVTAKVMTALARLEDQDWRVREAAAMVLAGYRPELRRLLFEDELTAEQYRLVSCLLRVSYAPASVTAAALYQGSP